jgi:L,D-peptidoglycan transpeptidase YkuD (ErfK/YbiS/YcfS/YnhG family)
LDRNAGMSIPQGISRATGQILIIARPASGISTTLSALGRRGDEWLPVASPIDAVVGRNGMALPGEKREGDGKTPVGLFPLEGAFGYAPSFATKMAYRQVDDDDVWVDDPNSLNYNTWQRRSEVRGVSTESLKRSDDLYEYGLIVGYNRKPVVKGLGSAIFIHAWIGPGRPTAGCVAVAKEDLVALLTWLDPAERPLVTVGP